MARGTLLQNPTGKESVKSQPSRRTPKAEAGGPKGYNEEEWMKKTQYDDRERRESLEYWKCDIPETPDLDPKPGSFYQVKHGDTLFGVVSAALGVGPGPERLALAQVINDDPCNLKFHTSNISPNEKKMFHGSRISFSPRFADDPEVQSKSSKGGRGHRFPIIRIPPPNWTKLGFADATGFDTATAEERASGLVSQSCENVALSGDDGCTRDYGPAIREASEFASGSVGRAYARFPRFGHTATGLTQNQRDALESHFNLVPPDFADRKNEDIVVEIRSKFAALNSKLKNKPYQVVCDSDGEVEPSCRQPGMLARASKRTFSICAEALVRDECDMLPYIIIHEIMHTIVGPGDGFDIYEFGKPDPRYKYGDLTAAQRSVNPDSYAKFALKAGGGDAKGCYKFATPPCTAEPRKVPDGTPR